MNNTDLFLWVSNLYFYWKLDISKLCYMVIFKCRSISPSVFTRISCSHVFVLFYFLFCWCWCCYCWFWLLISKIICVCMGGGVACTHMQMCLSVCTWRFIAWSIIFIYGSIPIALMQDLWTGSCPFWLDWLDSELSGSVCLNHSMLW